ncbi:Fe-S cluster assembly ATPase SufC [Candidatus Woesearchaeota archaeon]|nr:Fe-S cluster assembly ATPase SufC [Candidatus Woesearchaeota archaeon]
MLEIKDLNSEIEGKKILEGFSYKFEKGKVYAIMGQNGSGKSTFANSLMGNPKFDVKGSVILNGKNLLDLKPEDRSKEGLFLSFQYPEVIEGLKISSYLRSIVNARREKPISVPDFDDKLKDALSKLGLEEDFVKRQLNVGLSGGEKKKCEMLQMLLLNPEVIILDETDSGLDIDAIKIVANSVNSFKSPDKIIIVITHYKKMLELVKPDEVLILKNGKISMSGGDEIINRLEEEGYGWLD